MSEENKEADRRKGLGLRDAAVLVLGLAVAVAAGFGVKAYLEPKKAYLEPKAVSPGKEDLPLQLDWMFIDADDADLVIEGRKVYEANCADCHGFGLEGQPDWRRRGPDGVLPAPPHDETGHTWHHPDAVLFANVKMGGQFFMPHGFESGMPAYTDILSDREIEASLAYIKSRWPNGIRRRQAMRTTQSR